MRVTGKIGFSNHPMLEHFKFLKAHTSRTPKMTIPSPSVLHFRLEPGSVSKDAYANRDAIFDDLAIAYQKAIKAFYAAGCRYLQFDDTAWAYLCSQEQMQKARDRGLDADHLQETYTTCINKALEGEARRHDHHHACLPRQFPLHLHLLGRLRAGGARTCWPSAITTATSSNTTPTAPAASSRCASCRKATRSSCSASSRRRAARWRKRTTSSAASRRRPSIVALEQLCLSPQCGFASTEEGNVLAEDEQWAKLQMIVELANEVWGR